METPFDTLPPEEPSRIPLDRTYIVSELDRYTSERACVLSQICQSSGLEAIVESVLQGRQGGLGDFHRHFYSINVERGLAESRAASVTAANTRQTDQRAQGVSSAADAQTSQPASAPATTASLEPPSASSTTSPSDAPASAPPRDSKQQIPLKHSALAADLWGSLIRPASSKTVSIRWWKGRACLPSDGIALPAASRHERSKDLNCHADLSLKDVGADFVIYEYMEEDPLLMGCVGMAHSVRTFFRPSHLKKTYNGPALGPRNTKPRNLGWLEPVPDLLGGELKLKPGTGLAMMESSLVRAPIVRSWRLQTGFLLVSPRNGNLRLRFIKNLFTVGQLEPLVNICPPSAAKVQRQRCIHQMIRRTQLEAHARAARRKRRKAKKARSNFSALFKDVRGWWLKTDAGTVRQLCEEEACKDVKITQKDLETLTPEDICILDATERGKRRLEALKIFSAGHLVGQRRRLRHASYDRKFEIAIEELAELEAQNTGRKLAKTAQWIADQMQCAPWHVTSEHSSVLKSKRLFWSISGPGDPLGSRGDGVSFLRIFPSKIHHCARVSGLQQFSDGELKQELKKKGATSQQWKMLGRWEQVALLQELQGKHEDDEEFFSLFSKDKKVKQNPKTLHTDLLQATFDRQLAALGGEEKVTPEEPPPTEATTSSPEDSDEAEMLADLEAQMMANQEDLPLSPLSPNLALPSVLEAQDKQKPKSKRVKDRGDAAELNLLRGLLAKGGDEPEGQEQPDGQGEPARRKVKLLRVVTVEKNAMKRFVRREQYVREEHISRYLSEAKRAATVQPQLASQASKRIGFWGKPAKARMRMSEQ